MSTSPTEPASQSLVSKIWEALKTVGWHILGGRRGDLLLGAAIATATALGTTWLTGIDQNRQLVTNQRAAAYSKLSADFMTMGRIEVNTKSAFSSRVPTYSELSTLSDRANTTFEAMNQDLAVVYLEASNPGRLAALKSGGLYETFVDALTRAVEADKSSVPGPAFQYLDDHIADLSDNALNAYQAYNDAARTDLGIA